MGLFSQLVTAMAPLASTTLPLGEGSISYNTAASTLSRLSRSAMPLVWALFLSY